jgi:hypothetical protein
MKEYGNKSFGLNYCMRDCNLFRTLYNSKDDQIVMDYFFMT